MKRPAHVEPHDLPRAPLFGELHRPLDRSDRSRYHQLAGGVYVRDDDRLARARIAAHRFERRLLHPEGGIYGLFSDMTSLAMFRMRNRSLAVKNLYITGASTHFGGGVPTSVASGVVTADKIAQDFKL